MFKKISSTKWKVHPFSLKQWSKKLLNTVIGSKVTDCTQRSQKSWFLVGLLISRAASFEKQIIERNAGIDFFLKERSKSVSY